MTYYSLNRFQLIFSYLCGQMSRFMMSTRWNQSNHHERQPSPLCQKTLEQYLLQRTGARSHRTGYTFSTIKHIFLNTPLLSSQFFSDYMMQPNLSTLMCVYSLPLNLNTSNLCFICFLVTIAFALLVCRSHGQQEHTNGCETNCNVTYVPICGTDDSGKTKTFSNECLMKSENCLNKSSKYIDWSFYLC